MKMDPRRRRLVLASAATAVFPAFLARSASGQAARVEPPTVDSLTVRVLTDSSYDTPRIEPNKWVKIKRAPPQGSRKALHNQWGLALALESRIGNETRHVLLDSGLTSAALLNNMDYLGVDPTKFEAVIISHGHGDHFGGLIGFLEKYRAQLPRDLAVYVGGEDLFCARGRSRTPGGHLTDAGVLDRRELAKHDVRVVTCENPTVVGHALTTGWIPRTSFEQVLGPMAMVQYFPADGVGCDIPDANAKAQGKAVDDQHIHEHATCFNVKGRGLVVISSCGHAGIVNSARAALAVSGVKKLHAAMGGFHLYPASEDYLRKTIAEFKGLDPDVLVPMHCSGPSLIALLRSEMADRVATSTNGTEFTFGA